MGTGGGLCRYADLCRSDWEGAFANVKKKPSLNENVAVEEAARRSSEYLATIIHMIRRQTEIAANAQIATSALLKTIGEVFPERNDALREVYERYYSEDLKTSETAAQTRQIIAALDAMCHQAKYGS